MLIESTYKANLPIQDGHIETILPYFLRNPGKVDYQRERLELKDGDFLDLDWSKKGSRSLVILSHGLEGCSSSNYIVGLAQHLNQLGHDVLAWNNRGCSGEPNRLKRMYHSGVSDDLRAVFHHANTETYDSIYLVGFSMGGNITLKFLGEEAQDISPKIKKAVAISTPVSLEDCAHALSKGIRRVYTKHFIIQMVRKLSEKSKRIEDFNPNTLRLLRYWNFEDFDNEITAPINGFLNAKDYWQKASSLPLLKHIEIKTLILNAANDPFLEGRCYPIDEVKQHPNVDLEIPTRGGHVGFLEKGLQQVWHDQRISNFLFS